MDFIPEDRILKTRPDTLQVIRKEYNLDKPGQMKEAVNILENWVQKQSHFKKKDFLPSYYEASIIGCKGSIERAKTQLDKICTMRTLLPQFFGNYNLKMDFGDLYEIAYSVMLPKLTNDHYRVYVSKFHDMTTKASQYLDYYRGNIILAEYVKVHDYMNGFVMIIDFSEANLMEYITKLNLIDLKQSMTIYMEGYGMRIKGIHIITSSKFIDTLIAILKQVLNPKVTSRIHVHKTVDELEKYIPKEVLPKDYGGEERSLKELQAEWVETLSSEKHMNYIREMNTAATDETYRQEDKFTEQYAGMPGTFRLLSVD